MGIIWKGFGGSRPWTYMDEPQLRSFLLDRIKEGFSFPVNPARPVRDRGWYQILQALRSSRTADRGMVAWFPPGTGILETLDRLCSSYPEGFVRYRDSAENSGMRRRISLTEQRL